MAKIAVLITDKFEDVEYTEPASAFKEEGHELIHVGINEGKIVRGKKKGTEVKIDAAVENVSIENFDALLIPGGYSPDKLRVNKEAVDFAGGFLKSGKPVFSICHGAQILITADVLSGREVTGWKSIKQDIKNAGADYIDREVVVDDNLVSSRHPGDIPAFIRESLKKLRE